MCYEIVMFLEDSATDIALQDLLEMLLLMVSKVTGEKEVGPTYLASASFPLTQTSELSWTIADIVMAWIHYRSHLSLVHSHMVKQVSFLSEWFLAIIKRAMEGLLSSLSNISVLGVLTWILEWILSLPALEYRLLHPWNVQTNGFCPVWVNSWAYKCPLVMKY